MSLGVIVPQVAPSGEGVSAYAVAVGEELRRSHGTESHLVAAGANLGRTSRGLDHGLFLRQDLGAIVLHYVGYGYQARGVPRELVASIERVRRDRPELRCGVFFHEVWAFGPPWRSSFWLHPLQRSLARRLVRAADVAVTSLPRYRDLLAAMAPGKVVDLLPIPSTVGEPPFAGPHAERPMRLVVFGSAGVRERAYRRERAALETAARELGAREVVDIGGGSVAPREIAGVPVRALGQLSSKEVSRTLLDSRAGFLAYPPDFLDKSTIFGAYLAHGLVPVCAWSGSRGRAPRADEAWVRATANGLEGDRDLETVARRARGTYNGRSIARHAALWKQRLFPG